MTVQALLGLPAGIEGIAIQEGQGIVNFEVVSATALEPGKVLVEYNSPVVLANLDRNHHLPGMYSPAQYVIINQITLARVLVLYVEVDPTNDRRVILYTTAQNSLSHLLTINPSGVEDVYGNALDPTKNTTLFTGVPVSYEPVDALHLFQGSRTTDDLTDGGYFLPDVSAPYLDNENPTPLQTSVPQDTNIVFELLDPPPGVGVDESTVVITIDGITAWQNDAQQPGFSVLKESITGGLRFTIDPDDDFVESNNVVVGVFAYDLEIFPNLLDTSYYFTTLGTEPILQNQDPAPGDLDVDASKDIVLELIDPETGVNNDATILRINGITVFSAGVEQSGYTVTVEPITDGYRYTINPDLPIAPGPATVGVYAENSAEAPNILDTFYGFTVYHDVDAPYIYGIDPTAGAFDIPPTRNLVFSLGDDKQVLLEATSIAINDRFIFNGATQEWSGGWGQSFFVANNQNGYDFVVVPELGWEQGGTVKVEVSTLDSSGLSLGTSWFFEVGGVAFPFDVYTMFPEGQRKMDEHSPGLTQKMADIFTEMWETLIYNRATDLYNTAYDPDQIDARWLPYLKALVGFTRDLSFEATEDELRGIIANAMSFWRNKPAEPAMEFAVRMVTGNRYKIRNYFDFRTQADHSLVTELLEDFDPNMIDFPSDSIEGLELRWCDWTSEFPCTHRFSIDDLPPDRFPGGVFHDPKQFQFLQIVTWPADPSFEGFYRIDKFIEETTWGIVVATEPNGPVGSDVGTWRLWGANSDHITEIRLVDEPTGLGVINRDLFKFLLGLVRPYGERIDIVYLDFLDQFSVAGDLGLWTLDGPNLPTVPKPGGKAVVPVNSNMKVAASYSSGWRERVVAYKVSGLVGTKVELRFLYIDENNYYFAEVSWADSSIKVYKKASGADTLLGNELLTDLTPGYADLFRFDLLQDGADFRVRVKYNGDRIVEAVDSPASFVSGSVSIGSTGTTEAYLHLMEVMVLPVDVDRVGPEH